MDRANHLFTPLASEPCRYRVCPAPAAEHTDAVVIESYAALRAWRPAVAPALSCGHRARLMHSIDERWEHMERGVKCPTCDQIEALVAA